MPRWQDAFEWHASMTHGLVMRGTYMRIGLSPSKGVARAMGLPGRGVDALRTKRTTCSSLVYTFVGEERNLSGRRAVKLL